MAEMSHTSGGGETSHFPQKACWFMVTYFTSGCAKCWHYALFSLFEIHHNSLALSWLKTIPSVKSFCFFPQNKCFTFQPDEVQTQVPICSPPLVFDAGWARVLQRKWCKSKNKCWQSIPKPNVGYLRETAWVLAHGCSAAVWCWKALNAKAIQYVFNYQYTSIQYQLIGVSFVLAIWWASEKCCWLTSA